MNELAENLLAYIYIKFIFVFSQNVMNCGNGMSAYYFAGFCTQENRICYSSSKLSTSDHASKLWFHKCSFLSTFVSLEQCFQNLHYVLNESFRVLEDRKEMFDLNKIVEFTQIYNDITKISAWL